MERQIHDLVQGSPEWLKFRETHDGASEAAAVLGLSKKTSRNELLQMKALGLGKEFSDFVQKKILDKGHEIEALARPIIEEIIGEELFPATYSYGKLSASVDGITMAGTLALEHKQFEKELFAAVQSGILPEEHCPQTQQILYVTGAEKLIFAVSDGTADKLAYIYVEPDETWQKRILAGWKQFNEDVANYVPETPVVQVVAAPVMALPALSVRIRGEVIESNLPAYRAAATEFIAKISTELETDQDFADAANNIKFCEDSEKRLDSVKQDALAQTASIDELFKTLDFVREELRAKRLALEKLVEARKVSIRNEVIQGAKERLAKHIATCNERLGGNVMPTIAADFAGVVKGKRTVASLRNAVDTELANKKIEASEIADRIEINQRVYRVIAAEHSTLFPDLNVLLLKLADDFRNAIDKRIADNKKEQAAVAPPAPAAPPTSATSTVRVAVPLAEVSVAGVARPESAVAEQLHQSVLENIYLFASDRRYSDADARKTILDLVTPLVVRKKAA